MNLLSFRNLFALTLLSVGVILGSQSIKAEQVPAGESASIGAERQPQMQEITDALSRFKDRDLDGTLKYLEAAVKKNPELPPVYVLLAQFYSLANMPQGILSALEKAVDKNPDDPEAYIYLAQIAVQDRRVTEADLLYNKANTLLVKLDKYPKRKDALTPIVVSGLAQVYQSREDWTTAKKYLDQWLKLDPKNAQAMQRLGYVLFQQKDPQNALARLKEAKAADSKMMTPEATLAIYYQQAGDKENAKKWMATALSSAANDRDTQLIAAQLSLENGQLEDAKTAPRRHCASIPIRWTPKTSAA